MIDAMHCQTQKGETMLTDFDNLVKKSAELERWWKLGSTIAQYNHSCHVLRVDMCKPSLVSYCGQERAGAQNYHDAPAWFADCVRNEQQERFKEIATAAYEKELAKLNQQIEQHRVAVQEELARVPCSTT